MAGDAIDAQFLRAELAKGRNPVLISGYARLPDAVAGHEVFQRIGVVLVVDVDSGVVLAAEPTLLTALARDFLRALVVGRNLYSEPAEIIADIERHYRGGSGPALVTAFRHCLDSLLQIRGDIGPRPDVATDAHAGSPDGAPL
ncbi:MAG: DUF3870 domain-containing protein [Sciscionella sp.]